MAFNVTMQTGASFLTSPSAGYGEALGPGSKSFGWLMSSLGTNSLFSAVGTTVEIEAIFTGTSVVTRNSIVAMQDGLIALAVTSSGTVQAYVGSLKSGIQVSATSATTILDGNPHRIAAVFDGINALVFIDGVLSGTTACTSAVLATISWTSSQWGIGYYPGSSQPYVNQGTIDEIAVFSPARHTAAYTPATAPYTGAEAGLVALYHLDGDGTDSKATITPSTTYTLTGPTSLTTGSAATYTLVPDGSGPASAVTITPVSSLSGVFSPESVTLQASSTASATFTFTASTTGTGTLSTTNNGSLTDPATLSISATSASTPFSTYTLTGPSSLTAGSASTFTVTPGAGSAAVSAITITLASTLAGTFSPATVTIPAGSTAEETFTFTPDNAGSSGTLSSSNNGSLTNPPALTVSTPAAFSTYALKVPSAMTESVAATCTVTPGAGAARTSAAVITPQSTLTGTFNPTTVTIPAGSTSAVTFAFTPGATGTGTISTTNNASLTNPSGATFSVTAATTSFTTYTLTGPASLTAGSASGYTITPGSGAALSTAVTITPACTLSGTFSPSSVVIPAGSTAAQTFTFTPGAAGTGTLSATNSGSLTNPASMSIAVAAQAVQTGPMNNAAITYSPWNWSVSAAGAVSANPGAYLNFGFTGSTLQITCDVSANSGPLPEFYVVIDGQAPQLFTAAATVTVAMPSTTSSWPTHTCELIFKSSTCTENRWSPQQTSLVITDITLSSGALLSVIAPFEKKILVYGDSITEGYQSLQKLASTTTDAAVSDASLAWGYRLRHALGVEVGIVAFTGSGLTVTGNGNVPPLTTTWNQLWNGQPRDFTVAPDVIVMNEGTNDGAHNASQNAVQTAAVTVLQNLIATCPSAHIVVMQPFQGNGSYFTTTARTTVTAALQAAVAECTNGLVRWVSTDGWFTSTMPSADGTHPLGVSTIQDILPPAVTSLASLTQQNLRVYSFF